ncbi:hypothetical protein GSI_11121 [Ganoderma sinense ZZ0214-1]|uniref:Uncharacterized protein n=1 Tax=Ganoderma sinense ZZ0214-1 TaxID=1077348 RepID=A0A2G8RZ61_9APHY|nr:hypothetical protein GSI_11121 [Ganoderma sinense ZZ0214-1]
MTTSDCPPAEVNTLALELTQYFAYDATTLIVESSLSSLLFGVLTILAITATVLLLRRGSLRNKSIRIPLASTIILYTSSALYMAALATGGLFSETFNGIESLAALEATVLKQSWMATVALGINIILGDAIVWWRACVVWQHKAVYFTGAILLALTLVIGAIGTRKSYTNDLTDIYLMYSGSSVYANTAAALSLVTNVLATSLIAYKAWWGSSITFTSIVVVNDKRRYLGSDGSKTRVLRVLALFVESGSAYCGILIFILTYQFHYKTPGTFSDAGSTSYTGAIYPTSIIVITAFDCSPINCGLLSAGSKKEYIPSNAVRLSPRCTFCSHEPADGLDPPGNSGRMNRWRASQSPHGRSGTPSGQESGDWEGVKIDRDWIAIYRHRAELFGPIALEGLRPSLALIRDNAETEALGDEL